VIARWQLLDLGFSKRAIEHRLSTGRLHPLWPGVYAVGRREVTRKGMWMAAVLTCGEGALISHETAAALWGIRQERSRVIHVTVPARRTPKGRGIVVHRRDLEANDKRRKWRILVTSPTATLVDLAAGAERRAIERDVNEAAQGDLVDPERPRRALDKMPRRRGIRELREVLDPHTFRLTRSELERLFLAIVRRARLPIPLTRQIVNGFEVDFFWRELGLVVEADSLRYHPTAMKQTNDLLRDNAHTVADLTRLRFTHWQVRYDTQYVIETLTAIIQRLTPSSAPR